MFNASLAALIRTLCLVIGLLGMAGCSAVATYQSDSPKASAPALTAKDQTMAQAAFQNALEKSVSGKTTRWKNSTTGTGGSITPIKTWKTSSGVYCRSYKERIRLTSGQSQNDDGTACRSKNGGWKAA